MNPPQRSFSLVKGDAALRNPRRKAMVSEFVLAPGSGEKATRVGVEIQLNYEDAGNSSLIKDHSMLENLRPRGIQNPPSSLLNVSQPYHGQFAPAHAELSAIVRTEPN